MSAFTLDENQAMLAESARKYVERGYGEAVRHASAVHPHGCDPARWREFADFGWLALPLPEVHGGLDGSVADICVLAEELGRALVVEPWLPCGILAAGLMADAADEATAKQWLPALAAGERRVAFAAWEPGGRFDANRITTRADPFEGGFRLFGAKELVLGAPGADALLVSARVNGVVGLFLVDAAVPGLKTREHGLYDGTRGACVDFDGALAQACLGGGADIAAMIELAMDRALVAHSAQTVGAMVRTFEITLDYLKVRKQFGRILAGNQVLQHRLVDLFVAVEESRALVRAAAQSFDGNAGERRNVVAATKAFVSQAARTAWEEAVQMHGAIGMTEEYVIGRYVRHLAAAHTLFGDAEHHLERMARLEEVRHAGVGEVPSTA
jgi:alkylation response protein AidB-like acyl-CoA dehydrogenase